MHLWDDKSQKGHFWHPKSGTFGRVNVEHGALNALNGFDQKGPKSDENGHFSVILRVFWFMTNFGPKGGFTGSDTAKQ